MVRTYGQASTRYGFLITNKTAIPKGITPHERYGKRFCSGSSAGALLLESLDSALERKATIYAEILGGASNAGGQQGEGSMTAPNNETVQRCIRDAVKDAGIAAADIDLVNGHLTATAKDATEVRNWASARPQQP